MTVVMISSVVQLSQLNNLMKIYRILDSGSVLLLMALNRRKKLELEPINVLVIWILESRFYIHRSRLVYSFTRSMSFEMQPDAIIFE